MDWNLVALEPDTDRWLVLRPLLGRLGYRAVAMHNIPALESVVIAYDVDVVLIRPIGELTDHARLAELLRKTGTRVFVTAEVHRPQILSLYYALGEQTRTLRPAPQQLGVDILRHGRERVDRLPPVPAFGQTSRAASLAEPALTPATTNLVARASAAAPQSTERSPSRPELRSDRVAPALLDAIRLPNSAVG